MSAARGKGSRRRPPETEPPGASPPRPEARPDAGMRVPELLRRVVGMGFSGFFLTEEVVRKALGETLPRDWVDFAAAQSERTRRELIDRVAGEIGRALEGLDLPELAERLLRGHAIEVTAQLRFLPREEGTADAARPTGRRQALRIAVVDDEGAE